MESRKSRWIFAFIFAALATAIVLRATAQTHKDPPDQDGADQKEAIHAPSHVSIQNGQVTLKLSASAQALAGIVAAPLEGGRERKELTAPARVLDVGDLVNASARYAAGRADLQKARNNLSVSRREYERLKKLYADHQNASAKDLQAAEGRFKNQATDVRALAESLQLQIAAVRQSWGGQVAQWLANDSASLQRQLNRQALLVQITMPPEEAAFAPAAAALELPGGARATARRVSLFPRVDPRVQGISFLYETAARGVLEPGLNLVAHLSVGPRVAGVVVPSSAVVWWQGAAWVYVQTAAGEFVRRAVDTRDPIPGGFFVIHGFSPGERVVRGGAQALLTEEFRSQIQPED
jgi:uncharacterized protein YukE